MITLNHPNPTDLLLYLKYELFFIFIMYLSKKNKYITCKNISTLFYSYSVPLFSLLFFFFYYFKESLFFYYIYNQLFV